MCGRKYDSEVAEWERAVTHDNLIGQDRKRSTRVPLQKTLELPPPNFDIRPTNHHAVILAEDGEQALAVMRWGFKPEWARMTLFNSRADKLTGRAWGKSFRERRCVIPVGGFYEWTGPKKAREPHAIQYASRPVMYLAGLWLEHEGEPCYSVITTEAGKFMAALHDREPVIVREDEIAAYLFAEKPPFEMMHATEDGELTEFACPAPGKNTPPKPL
jgi:putative SOS response-associated peptidase YedK